MACNCNYEYEVVEGVNSGSIESTLNTLGSNGWSVVWIDRNHSNGLYYALLKRHL